MAPEIDYDLCIGCGKCVDACAEDVFFGTEGFGNRGEMPVVTYPEACFHCKACVEECPVQGAIWLRTPLVMTVPFKRSLLGQKDNQQTGT